MGDDCAELVEEIDASGRAACQNNDPRSNSDLLAPISFHSERERISAMAPEDIDVFDLEIAERETWDDLQWERADLSGLLERSGIFDDLPEPL